MITINKATLHNMDCMELMKQYPDGYFDLAIVDPPYRDENQPTKDMRARGSMKTLEGRPTPAYYEELYRVSKNQIIWGANNFQLPQFKGFVVWEKGIPEDFTMSIACNNLGFELVACELDQDYFNASVERIKREAQQERLFA